MAITQQGPISIIQKFKSTERSSSFQIASWNIQGGINSKREAEIMMQDLISRKVDIGCLQETKCGIFQHETKDGHLFIALDHLDSTPIPLRYGQGFFISNRMRDRFMGTIKISERISILRLMMNAPQRSKHHRRTKASIISIINVYAPTAERARNYPEEYNTFYDQLNKTYHDTKRHSTITILAGDFNSKLGLKQNNTESFMGAFGKGSRNRNGNVLSNFLMEHSLYATNTHFRHKLSHISTWHGFTRGTWYHNQIDYILIPQPLKGMLTQSRSYNGHFFETDHSMIVTSLNIAQYYKFSIKQNKKRESSAADTSKLNYELLTDSKSDVKFNYQKALNEKLASAKFSSDLNKSYQVLADLILEAASDTIPKIDTSEHIDPYIKYQEDGRLQELSEANKNIRQQLQDMDSPVNITKARQLRSTKNANNTSIKNRIKELQTQKIDALTKELQSNHSSRWIFESKDKLRFKEYDPLSLKDEEGYESNNPNHVMELILAFYKQFFNQENIPPLLSSWEGDPSPLSAPITAQEVEDAAQKLNNRRATGMDKIAAELIKYGSKELYNIIADLYNSIFDLHSHLDVIGQGILIPLNKPNKPRTATNTRPITLLNSVRKLLSIVLLQRIYPTIDKYLSTGQSGFRKMRSTGDVVWTYRWLMAIAYKYNQTFQVMGIDMSKAFDCINRTKLLEIMKQQLQLSSDNFRILKYLVTHTTLTPRIKGIYGETFTTSIGVPQGDSLSPILFTVYLESALREYRNTRNIPQTPSLFHWNNEFQKFMFYLETMYADDTDIITMAREILGGTLTCLEITLALYNLKVNATKTEYIEISRLLQSCLKNRKLGSMLGTDHDIDTRISKANAAFGALYRIWNNRKHIKLETKRKLYYACIIPILTYNLSASAASSSKLEGLNKAHRTHLRKIAGIYYPNIITNDKLYKLFNVEPISSIVYRGRLRLLRTVLHQGNKAPAHMVMTLYFHMDKFKSQYEKVRGRKQQSLLPDIITNMLQIGGYKFSTTNDMWALKLLSQDKKVWEKETEYMVDLLNQQDKQASITKKLKQKERKKQQNIIDTVCIGELNGRKISLTIKNPSNKGRGTKRPIENTTAVEESRYNNQQNKEARRQNRIDIQAFNFNTARNM